MNRFKYKTAFTLIELLVVIAIIALLLSIIAPALRVAKQRAHDVICSSNLSQVGKAMHAYALAFNNRVPSGDIEQGRETWMARLAPFLDGRSFSIEDYWEIKAYDCPAYPMREHHQTVKFVMNSWDGSPRQQGEINLGQLRSPTARVYMSDYAYSRWVEDPPGSGKWRDTGEKLPAVRIVTPDDIRLGTAAMFEKMRWLDVWNATHLPTTNNEANRRVARGRHKRTGTNNLFFDGHVDWITAEENDARFWRID